MTQKQYLERFTALQQFKISLTTKKNTDYAGKTDAFKNFRLIDIVTEGRLSTADGLLVRMTDKLARVANLMIAPPSVSGENLKDSLDDLAVYSDILNLWYASSMTDEQFFAMLGQAAPTPAGYQELPEDAPQQTLDETYDALVAKILAGKVHELSPTDRSYVEMVVKMKMQTLSEAA